MQNDPDKLKNKVLRSNHTRNSLFSKMAVKRMQNASMARSIEKKAKEIDFFKEIG